MGFFTCLIFVILLIILKIIVIFYYVYFIDGVIEVRGSYDLISGVLGW